MDAGLKQHTITLTERKPSLCRLKQADVDFLLSRHATHLRLMPSSRRGVYRCMPSNHVGVILTPTCRIIIRPKIPMKNLFHLLDETRPPAVVEDRTAPTPGTEALQFLAGRLARLLDERAAAGLHRGYAERAERAQFLQGQLDVPAQLQAPAGRKDQFHCRFEEFTVDVPCNQIPKATAELALQSPLLGDLGRAALRRSLDAFAGVTSIRLEIHDFDPAVSGRFLETYRPLLALCQWLYQALTPGENAGTSPCPAFLLDMEEVFERYCTAHIVKAFAADRDVEYAVAVQPLFRADRSLAQQPALTMRPDIIIDRRGKAVLVLDTKWKRLTTTPFITPDVYQVLAYCAALGIERAMLVYPGTRGRSWQYRLSRAPVQLAICALRVAGPRQACARSAQRLTRLIQRIARGHRADERE